MRAATRVPGIVFQDVEDSTISGGCPRAVNHSTMVRDNQHHL
jgi:hypothetical protein